MATFTSTQSGPWNDPATWGGGGFPQNAGDIANIGTTPGTSHIVTYNLSLDAELGAVTVGATSGIGTPVLQFARDMNTKLTLGHQDLLINQSGWGKVGESGLVIPKNYTAQLVWHTTADNAKGINLAAGGKLTVYGDPTYYGSKYDYLLATQVVIPAAGNAVTITITGNYAANFLAGQELLIHKGGTYASYINDFARLAVVSAANNGANADISCTVTERPAALTCLVGADVLHVSRNVLLYLLNYNPSLGQWNSNRPRMANANAVNTQNVDINDAVFAGWNTAIAGVCKQFNGVVRNSDRLSPRQGTVDGVIFSLNYGVYPALWSTVSGFICACNYAVNGGLDTTFAGSVFGNGIGIKNYSINCIMSGYYYNNGQAIASPLNCMVTGSVGFDRFGNTRNNTYDFSYAQDGGYGRNICKVINAKVPTSPSFQYRNIPVTWQGRYQFEHYQQVANAHYVADAFGDLLKVLADGSGVVPSQRAGGSRYVEQVTPQSNCNTTNYLEILNVRVWAAAGVSKTYTFYIQNNFGKTLTDSMLALYADYLDNNPSGTGHLSTVQSSGVSIAQRANQADWSQSISVTVTPQVEGWVNLYLRLMDGTAASLWVDPMMAVS